MPGIIGESVSKLFDKKNTGFSDRANFTSAACRLLSNKFEDNIKLVFEIYDFDNDNIISREDIRVVLSYVPLSEILACKKSNGRQEGNFTKNGGGLYGY